MAELHTVRVATVFTADTQLDVWIGLAAFFDGDFNKLADAGGIQSGKRILLEDFSLCIRHEEGTHVVSADAESSLSEVIRAEREELGGLSDFVRSEGTTRDFDHGSDKVIKFDLLLGHHFFGDAIDDFHLKIKLALESDKRNHDFWLHLDLLFGNVSGSFKDSAGLHLGDLGVGDAKTATAVTQHWVELMQRFDAMSDLLDSDSKFFSQILLLSFRVREELMKRWVKETNGRRQTFESFKDACEVFTLVWQKLAKSSTTVRFCGRENHLTHGINAVTFKEHVFCAGKADTLSTESDSVLSLLRIIGIGADLHARSLGTPCHELVEAFEFLSGLSGLVTMDHARDDFGRSCFQLTSINNTAGAVDREEVTFVEGLTRDRNSLLVIIDLQCRGTANANFTHLTSHQGCM